MNNERETVREFEVISLDGRDMVTLVINGKTYDMPVAVAKVLAADLSKRREAGDELNTEPSGSAPETGNQDTSRGARYT